VSRLRARHLNLGGANQVSSEYINGIRSDNRIENLELFSSRHGPGQRVVDKVQFAIEILTLYPEFAKTAGYELHKLTHATVSPP
jgi:hypothetical protein